jgi:hypothetical protein
VYLTLLAAHLARAENMMPITDRARLPGFDARGEASTAQLSDRMRGAVLKDALPAPAHPISARDLHAFKERHDDLLRRFRRHVERELIECARESDKDLRAIMLGQLADDIREGVVELQARMTERRWPTVPGMLCAAVTGAPAAVQAVAGGDPYAAANVAAAGLAEIVRAALTGPHPRRMGRR